MQGILGVAGVVVLDEAEAVLEVDLADVAKLGELVMQVSLPCG
jgi:hypothetical protein